MWPISPLYNHGCSTHLRRVNNPKIWTSANYKQVWQERCSSPFLGSCCFFWCITVSLLVQRSDDVVMTWGNSDAQNHLLSLRTATTAPRLIASLGLQAGTISKWHKNNVYLDGYRKDICSMQKILFMSLLLLKMFPPSRVSNSWCQVSKYLDGLAASSMSKEE